jgi:hypothetical protein
MSKAKRNPDTLKMLRSANGKACTTCCNTNIGLPCAVCYAMGFTTPREIIVTCSGVTTGGGGCENLPGNYSVTAAYDAGILNREITLQQDATNRCKWVSDWVAGDGGYLNEWTVADCAGDVRYTAYIEYVRLTLILSGNVMDLEAEIKGTVKDWRTGGSYQTTFVGFNPYHVWYTMSGVFANCFHSSVMSFSQELLHGGNYLDIFIGGSFSVST